jgi:hypothetical protein
MKSVIYSPAFIRKRKFLMMLPVLVSPFVVLLFFILGGGKGSSNTTSLNTHSGLNLQLPDAHFGKKKDKGKMDLYGASDQDSARWKMSMNNDPYWKESKDSGGLRSLAFDKMKDFQELMNKTAKSFSDKNFHGFQSPSSASGSLGFARLNGNTGHVMPGAGREKEVMEKLELLRKQITRPVSPPPSTNLPGHKSASENENSGNSTEKISEMLRALNQKNEPDPKIAELNNMLDKVMAIQHPELRKDSGQKNIMSKSEDLHITTVSGDNSITAVIPEKQTLVSGATIRLRTTDSFRIGKIRIPSDQLIYGVVSLSNERLRIIIKTLRAGNNILPINLEVFDMDGLAGLYIPGSISRDVSKESFDQGMNGIGLSAFDPSIGAQAASAGIQAAKTLISRKVKLVRVTIEDGYQVLLKESH